MEERLIKFEEVRCELVHSSVNQFVVFEKFAEMNNKYDVKNFSDLIDQFKIEDEMKVIKDFIDDEAKNLRSNPVGCLFDPLIEKDG
jgi:hypothetical protein